MYLRILTSFLIYFIYSIKVCHQIDVSPKIQEWVVKTSVANRFAVTKVTSKVKNENNEPAQTIFSLVLPELALVSSFLIQVDGKPYPASVKEKKEAEKLFGQPGNNSAPFLSTSTRNSQRFTVNITTPPQSIVSFQLTYEELLQRERGQYEIITNIQLEQIVEKLQIEVEITENKPFSFVKIPALRSGNDLVLEDVFKLDPKPEVNISNTTAIIKFQPDVNQQLQFACAGLANKDYGGFAGQFVVQYDIQRDDGGETLYQDDFFVNFFAPPALEPIPKHIVFVVDTSVSMIGTKIEQLKDAMYNILPQLYNEDLFSIVQYSSKVYLWNPDLTYIDVLPGKPKYGKLANHLQIIKIPEAFPTTHDNIEKAKQIISTFRASGGTNSIGALEVALYLVNLEQNKHKHKYQPIIVFLTDGLPTKGIKDVSQIVSLISKINSKQHNTPIYSICIGTDADWTFLERLSLTTKAKSTRIHVEHLNNSDVSSQLQNFYKKIGTPVLRNITFKNLPSSSQFSHIQYPIFFSGSEIIIAGKGPFAKIPIKPIKVSALCKKGVIELETKIGMPVARLERIWAHLTLKQLIDDFHVANEPNKITQYKKLAVDIALKYSLVSVRLTSLVVTKPNGVKIVVNPVDGSKGSYPTPSDKLSVCRNIIAIIKTTTIKTTTTKKAITTENPTGTGTKKATTTTKMITSTSKQTTIKTTTTPTKTKATMKTTTKPTMKTTRITQPTTTTKKITKTCKDTPFGCCPDQITTATGYNNSGCDPEPKPESCLLPLDPGRCPKSIITKYSVKWAFNFYFGECRKFWYSGCRGTDNRFASKEECDRVCEKKKIVNKK